MFIRIGHYRIYLYTMIIIKSEILSKSAPTTELRWHFSDFVHEHVVHLFLPVDGDDASLVAAAIAMVEARWTIGTGVILIIVVKIAVPAVTAVVVREESLSWLRHVAQVSVSWWRFLRYWLLFPLVGPYKPERVRIEIGSFPISLFSAIGCYTLEEWWQR